MQMENIPAITATVMTAAIAMTYFIVAVTVIQINAAHL